jgi:hypothetical protein
LSEAGNNCDAGPVEDDFKAKSEVIISLGTTGRE